MILPYILEAKGAYNYVSCKLLYSTLKNNLKDYCDEASDNNQTIIVTRKKSKSIVIMSLDNYNQLMKNARNAEYLAKLDRSMEQIKSGFGEVHEEKNL